MAVNDGTYRASVGDVSFDIIIEGGTLSIDAEETEYSFEQIAEHTYVLWLEGRSYSVTAVGREDGLFDITVAARRREVRVQDERALLLERYGLEDAASAADKQIHAPMPGLVLQIHVDVGQSVEAGQGLLVLEAMKMENELRAPADGVIADVHVRAGDAVGKNALLIELEDDQ